jgi:hypothetical protein
MRQRFHLKVNKHLATFFDKDRNPRTFGFMEDQRVWN